MKELREDKFEAERAVIADCLDDFLEGHPCYAAAAAVVSAGDFLSQPWAACFDAIGEMHQEGVLVTPVSVATRLQPSGRLAGIGGVQGLELLRGMGVPDPGTTRAHALIVRRASLRLQQQVAAGKLQEALRLGKDASTLLAALAELQRQEQELGKTQVVSVSVLDCGDLYEETAPVVIPSCLPALNEVLGGGYQSHSYVLVNGATKHGKSSLALQEARFQAEQGRPTLVVSVEMRRREMTSRLASQRLSASHQLINRTYWRAEHADDMARALAGLDALSILEFRRGRGRGVTVRLSALFDEVKRLSDLWGRSCFVVLDYTQRLLSRIEGLQNQKDPRIAMGALSDTIAEGTRDLGACFFVLSAIPRHMYGEKGAKLDNDQLTGASAEGGGLEYDAGAVLFLRKELHLPDGRARATLRVTGQRYAGAADRSIRLIFDGAHNLFTPDATPEEDLIREAVLKLLEQHYGGLSGNRICEILKKLKLGKNRAGTFAKLAEMVDAGELWNGVPPLSKHPVYRLAKNAPTQQTLPQT